ncbi:MAG: hypothetical protein DMF74_25105, partial [Acidobacteria bacterium]
MVIVDSLGRSQNNDAERSDTAVLLVQAVSDASPIRQLTGRNLILRSAAMRRLFFLLLTMAYTIPGGAPVTPSMIPVQERATLQEVLARTKAAAGGAAWDKIHTMRIRWEAEEGGLKGTVDETDDLVAVRYADAWDFGLRSGAFGFNGKIVWSQDSSGLSQVQEGSDAREGATNEAYRRSLAYWFPERWRAKLEYKGEEQDEGLRFFVLKVIPERGRP